MRDEAWDGQSADRVLRQWRGAGSQLSDDFDAETVDWQAGKTSNAPRRGVWGSDMHEDVCGSPKMTDRDREASNL